MGLEIKLRGLNKVRAKGRVYWYHRKTGKRIPDGLLAPERAKDLLALVERLNGKIEAAALPGTLGALIVAYKTSPEFLGLAPRTREDYDRVFDYLADIDGMPIDCEFDEEFVIGVRDDAFKVHKRHFANYVVKVLSLLFNWAKPRGWLKRIGRNPASEVPKIRRPKNTPRANPPWTVEEYETVQAAAKARAPQLVLPLLLGRHTPLREGDVLIFPRTAYKQGQINTVMAKNGEPHYQPVPASLRVALEDIPRDHPSTIFCLNSRKRPWTESGFRASFFKLIRDLKKEGKITRGLTFHGLARHTDGDELADLGFSSRDIADYLGDKSEQMGKHYSAGKQKRVAVEKMTRALERNRDKIAKPSGRNCKTRTDGKRL